LKLSASGRPLQSRPLGPRQVLPGAVVECLLGCTFLIREELGPSWSSAILLRVALPAYDAAFMTAKISPRPSGLREKSQLMSASEIERTLVRLVHEIIEKNNGAADLGLVGIRRRGVPLAQRLGQMIARIEKTPVPVGTLDITLYRDDLSTLGPKPVVQKAEIGFPIGGKNIILVDDVLYTGRTIRAALDALFREGRPKRVQLCVLIDRGHRELPIEARFIGRKVQTSDREIIEVKLREVDDAEKVLLVERQD
jgi:pyrimidine operon attenuation protein / uracil phosphoribosyltransferase